MFLGLKTAIYRVPDIASAKAWYRDAFEIEPYYDEPYYVGFKVGENELGLDPDIGQGQPGPGGATAFWSVQGIEAVFDRFVALGASPTVPVHDVGEGIKVGTVSDPYGNLIGLIETP